MCWPACKQGRLVPCTAPAVQSVLTLPLSTTLQGVLTPFDRLEGFERRVQSKGQDAAAAGGTAGQPGLQGAGMMLGLLGLSTLQIAPIWVRLAVQASCVVPALCSLRALSSFARCCCDLLTLLLGQLDGGAILGMVL